MRWIGVEGRKRRDSKKSIYENDRRINVIFYNFAKKRIINLGISKTRFIILINFERINTFFLII